MEPLRRRYSDAGEYRVDDFDGDLTLSLRLNEHMESQIFWYGSYSRDILLALRHIVKPGMTALDVGGNIGEISVFLAKYVGPEGKVWSFEPMPALADRLDRHKELNTLSQLEICRAGLGHEATELPMYASEYYHGDGLPHSGMITLFRSEERSIEVGSVPVIRLDDFVQKRNIKRIDIMKVDIEGAELSMLQGAEETLHRDHPIIILEVNEETSLSAGYKAADLLIHLKRFGYDFHRIGNKGKLIPISPSTLGRFQNVLCTPSHP